MAKDRSAATVIGLRERREHTKRVTSTNPKPVDFIILFSHGWISFGRSFGFFFYCVEYANKGRIRLMVKHKKTLQVASILQDLGTD
jgi:hypothetical protein